MITLPPGDTILNAACPEPLYGHIRRLHRRRSERADRDRGNRGHAHQEIADLSPPSDCDVNQSSPVYVG